MTAEVRQRVTPTTVPVRLRGASPHLPGEALSPIFQAVIEATEEAIYNSILLATGVRGP